MRKALTFLLASALTTGAVQASNADEFDVTNDPSSYITIGGITGVATPSETDDPALPSDGIMPVIGTSFSTSSSLSEWNRLPLEVKTSLGNASLELVEVCLYNPNVITGETIATNCGTGTLAGTAHNTLTANMKSAVPFAITDLDNLPESYPKTVATAQAGVPYLAGNLSASDSPFELEGTSADEVMTGQVWFRLNMQPLSTDGWKVRVQAKYTEVGEDDILLELESTETYKVAYVSELVVGQDARQPVVYGDVIQGGFKEETGIKTGKYRANAASNVFLEADPFEDSEDSPLTFGDPASLGASEVSLSCEPSSATSYTDFFTNSGEDVSKTLLSVPYDVPNGSTFSDALETHDCKLSVGSEVSTGSYDNVMTVSMSAQ